MTELFCDGSLHMIRLTRLTPRMIVAEGMEGKVRSHQTYTMMYRGR